MRRRLRRPGRCLILAILLFGAGAAVAAGGGLHYTTTYRTNPIRGTTPAAVWRFMAEHPIHDEDGPALANITHDHSLSVKTGMDGGTCRVTGLDFTWRFVITLPKAVDAGRMSPQTRRMWGEFTRYLKTHEEHHRAIFLDCGERFLAKAGKLTARGTCNGLERKVRRLIDKDYAACMRRQRDFDRQDAKNLANLSLRRAAGK